MAYQADGAKLIIIGVDDYGMGSSRDWAAKGTRLLGVSAVVTKSFERIHRSNLIGMGVLPLNFINADDYDKVKHLADARFDITGIHGELKPMQDALLVCHLTDHSRIEIPLKVRLDTPAEVDYYLAGGACLTCWIRSWRKTRSGGLRSARRFQRSLSLKGKRPVSIATGQSRIRTGGAGFSPMHLRIQTQGRFWKPGSGPFSS